MKIINDLILSLKENDCPVEVFMSVPSGQLLLVRTVVFLQLLEKRVLRMRRV